MVMASLRWLAALSVTLTHEMLLLWFITQPFAQLGIVVMIRYNDCRTMALKHPSSNY